jgi:Na+/phosphate symporter
MATDLKKKAFFEQLKALCPIVDNLRLMLGEARHAFNRHSLAKLAEIAQLQDDITLDLDPIFEQLEAALAQPSAADDPDLLKFQEILSNLEKMADRIAKLAEPIRRKGNQGIILSDKDFFHVNDLFSQQMGFLRALVDIFLYDDASLKAYVLNESQKVRDTCFKEEVTHETRMMDSPGQHNAWAVYIAMLERFGEISVHLLEIVKILE